VVVQSSVSTANGSQTQDVGRETEREHKSPTPKEEESHR
jgi:hypothetical protein